MRKKLLYNILGVFAILVAFTSCDEDDVSSPIGTGDYPTVTFTTDFTGTQVFEGDVITYQIKLDKVSEYNQTFSLKTSGTADEHDVTFPDEVTIPAYSTEAEFKIEFLVDNLPEDETKTFSFELGEFNLGTRYFLNPESVNPMMDLTLVSKNNPTLLTVAMDWSNDEDIDIVTWSATGGEWGAGGATSAQPEIDMAIWLSDPVGTYYVNIMHWGGPTFDYSFSIGHPDGTNQFIEGTFDADNLDMYVNDNWLAWGGSGYDSFRILKVVNDGTKFVVTKL